MGRGSLRRYDKDYFLMDIFIRSLVLNCKFLKASSLSIRCDLGEKRKKNTTQFC